MSRSVKSSSRGQRLRINAQQPPGSRLTQFEMQTWRWDFVSSPFHPEQGQLLDRVIIDISDGDETRDKRRMVGRSFQRW